VKHQERPAKAKTAKGGTAVSLLRMEIQIGDWFTDEGFEWQVLTHPAALHGGKSLRARVQRAGLPETERDMTWPSHVRVDIRRGTDK
jgi:arylamine N-acetyltransferase